METAPNQYEGETCIICEESKAGGIHICNQLICDACQQKIIEASVDGEQYKYFIKKLGKISLKIVNQKEVPEGKCQ
ncbi:sigma factor G inhibitor Gin [Camelliibacillus cellulosilyticus]|uniref:Sigma factor G inhibitor Gin n=1 Tax=Camelliibacillus cellulosilyticus TaxID=2174486 RepID=A0ABV9GQ28_9BACL